MRQVRSSEACWDEFLLRLERLTGLDKNFHEIKHLVEQIEKYAYNEGMKSVNLTKRPK